MDQPKILVAIRKRPLSKKEQSKGQTDIISVKNHQTVIVSEYKQKVDLTKYIEETVFNFDFAFDENTNNQQIYFSAIRPLVDSAFQGAKVTCFAYGQTGSGKTFTMNGNLKMGVHGLYSLGASDIFAYLNDSRFSHLTAKLSFFEIYCGKLFDLLNKRTQLTLRQDNKNNINIIGLEQTPVDTIQKFQDLLNYGSTQRVTSQNSANNQSSRSHAILQIILKEGKKVYGKISFIDLAGNQRGADHTDMKKQTRIDGAEINKSLLSLKECIRGLDQGKGHIPFRGSKLTMVLKDSFVGFCRTIMIGNVSPSSASSENTLNTLRYADRVKQLRKPSEPLSKEEMKARQMMLPRQNNNAIKIDINKEDDADDIQMKRRQAQKNYGIRQQSPKHPIPRDMSSDPYRKNPIQPLPLPQHKPGTKPILTNQQPINPMNLHNNKQQQQPKSPGMSNNFSKIVVPNNPNKQGQSSDRNLFNNPHHDSGRQDHGNRQPGGHSGQINGPKAIFEGRMEIEPPSHMTSSQVINRQNGNFMQPNQPNQHSQHGHGYMAQSGFNQNRSDIFQQGGYQQQPQQQQGYQQQQNYQYQNSQFQNRIQQQQQSNQQFQQGGRPGAIQEKFNQYRSNYQQPDQRPHSLNRDQYQPQPIQFNKAPQYIPKPPLPTDFQGMMQLVSTTPDPQIRQTVHQKLHEQLFAQENQLIDSHSDTLRSSLEHLRSQMSLIADLKNNRDAVSTREYIQLMQDNIDEKISLLEMLRQKMIQFTYKLERVEEIDQNYERMRGQDQQLLDDLH